MSVAAWAANERKKPPLMRPPSPRGFSANPVTRKRSSTATMPKRDASSQGHAMVARVASAPWLS